jgi:hypothetical protein
VYVVVLADAPPMYARVTFAVLDAQVELAYRMPVVQMSVPHTLMGVVSLLRVVSVAFVEELRARSTLAQTRVVQIGLAEVEQPAYVQLTNVVLEVLVQVLFSNEQD